jgi:hypothetical protein
MPVTRIRHCRLGRDLGMFERSTGRFRASLARLTGREDDKVADAHGWEIERARFGRRVYRDPRFAALRAAAARQPEVPEDLVDDLAAGLAADLAQELAWPGGDR